LRPSGEIVTCFFIRLLAWSSTKYRLSQCGKRGEYFWTSDYLF